MRQEAKECATNSVERKLEPWKMRMRYAVTACRDTSYIVNLGSARPAAPS